MTATMITQAQVAALRAALDGDEETLERFAAPTDFLGGEGFLVLVATAFVLAAQRRFPPGWAVSDVVRFVDHLRTRDGGAGAALSATVAEQMLLSVLSKKPMSGEFDEFTMGVTQFALLIELVNDLNDTALGNFLTRARDRADAWLQLSDSQ
jgi:hypothetical protein